MSILTETFMWSVTNVALFGPAPFQVKTSFDAYWLGEVDGDLFTVEIKDPNGELGWLYSKQLFVAYARGLQTFGIRLSDLKLAAEEGLKDKQFIAADAPPQMGKLKRIGKSIVGYIHIDSLRKYISVL